MVNEKNRGKLKGKKVWRMPKTSDDWQVAVDVAYCMLVLDSCKQYGLLTGGLKINQDRCSMIMEMGEQKGYKPSDDAVERFVAELNMDECNK